MVSLNQGWRVVKSATIVADMATDDLNDTPEDIVARRVRELRVERGLSLSGLAQASTEAGFPLTKSILHKIEKGELRVNLNTVDGLAAVLGVSPLVLQLPADADTWVRVAGAKMTRAAALYEWMVGARPAPTSGDVTSKARSSARIRFRKYLPYASLIPGGRMKHNENEIADMLREDGKDEN